MTERDIFIAALQKDDQAQRQVYLEEACAQQPELRAQVEDLLQLYESAGSFLQQPAAASAATGAFQRAIESISLSVAPGAVIGPYKLLQQIGEGGMGTVFMAEQSQPVQRTVALKVIKPGMDSRQIIARFEAERQALALMDHVNIARVLDAGAIEAGRPYFVMELVHGVPLTRYCDDGRLTLRERLKLFIPVCQAIEHAHQKGIVHRDIKPSNVMVTLYDGQPVPKVIDFGVAKAMERRPTTDTLFTQYGAMVGTLEYMSPEQVAMSAQGVDTRSDIYSLGVLLYELLTGSTPLTRKQIREIPHGEVLRLIGEEEPSTPSTRLVNSAAELTVIAERRRLEPGKLPLLVRGELDWIVMKCLEKDRNRRYGTASALAADVQRYLNDEPVLACQPTGWYRIRKLARRNWRALLAASATVLVVVMALVGSAVSNVLIRQEQARTQGETVRAQAAQKLAQDRAGEIQEGLERLKAANALLDRGRWYGHVREWDVAHASYTKATQLRPDHATAWVERGELNALLGLWDLAAADFAEEQALREPDATTRLYHLALLRLFIGDADGYREVCHRMRERFDGTLNGHFASEVIRATALGPGPESELAPLLEVGQNLLASDPGSWYLHYLLGKTQYRAGQHERAVQQLRESLLGPPDTAATAMGQPVLAMACHRLGQAAEARQALHAAAEAIERWTQDRYQIRGNFWLQHGASTQWPIAWWDWLECQLNYREAKLLIDGAPPPDDPRLHVLRARAFAGLHWWDHALPEYDAALQLSPQDLQIRAEASHNRGFHHTNLGQWNAAAAEFARGCELTPWHSRLWRYRALAEIAAGDVDVYRQTCAAMLERFGKTDDRDTAGNVLLVCVLRNDALTDMTRLLPLIDVARPMWHWGAWARGAALYRAGRHGDSLECFESAAKIHRPRAWDWCFQAMAHHDQGQTEEARRCLNEAARWIDEADRVQTDDPTTLGPRWGNWHERVVYPLLYQEATALIGEKDQPG